MATTCCDRFMAIIRITRIFAAICGADCLHEGYKINFITCFVVVAINAYFCCTIYTIYVAFMVADNWKLALETLSLLGSAVQGYSKLICGIKHRFILISFIQRLENIYREYQKDEDYLQILRKSTDSITAILKAVMSIYVMVSVGTIFYPLIYNQVYGKKLLIMQFFLPGIDHTTTTGHWIYNAVHATLILMGSLGGFAADMFIFVFIAHVPLLKDILKTKCKQFNRVILETKDPKKTTPVLKDIIRWHQNYIMYVQDIEDAYHSVIFIQIFTSVLSISCTLFTIVIRSWPAAFVYLIYSLCLFYAYCGLGNLVDVSNDAVTDAIYMDWLWYELSIPEQKLILLMLRKSQVPVSLTIGHIMPLSMSTALQLTKAIYSYLMMLVNFLDDV